MDYWQEVAICVNYEAQEGVTEILINHGAKGVAMEGDIIMQQALDAKQGDYYPSFTGNPEIAIKAYFSEPKTHSQLMQLLDAVHQLTEFGLNVGEVSLTWRIVCDEDWANAWKSHYHPMTIGNVVIQPSWERLPPQKGRIQVTLDPGMAFGTGTHPSTRMCIEALQKILLTRKRVWDIGTGSGILAIVASKLGATHIEAVDLDPVAIRVCSFNAQLNQVGLEPKEGSIDQLSGKADVIIANIIADVIIDILPQVSEKLSNEGYFLASGIIKQRASEVKQQGAIHGLKLKWEQQEGEWVFYCFQQGELGYGKN